MVCEWGMLPGSEEAYLFSQAQKDAACPQWLSQAQQTAAAVLTRHRHAWELLSERLLAEEAVDGAAVERCLEEEGMALS